MQHCVFDAILLTCYVPRDIPESATNVSSEMNDSTRVLNCIHKDSDITEGTESPTTDEENSSFTDALSDSGHLNYIPCITIINEEDEMVEEYP